MGNNPFMRPVFLRQDHGLATSYQARNASEAIEYLENFWPTRRTTEYRRAKAICRSAVDNLVSAESARNYLIAAAEHAGILDRRGKTRLARTGRLSGRSSRTALPAQTAA